VSEIPSALERWEREPAIADPRRRYVVENGPGLLASSLLHGLALLLVLVVVRTAIPPAHDQLKTVLVDIIHLGAETSAPPAPKKSPVPQSQAFARRAPTAHSPPVGVKPAKTPTKDDFQNRLDSLSKLRAPETSTHALAGPGYTDAPENTTNDSTAGDAIYSLRDYVRAQVMRRWNLDLDLVGSHRVIVALHVSMKSNGVIALAEIVDKQRYATDAIYRQIAMSARNAVILSSPISLPPGNYPAITDMTLRLDPRDATH
jgi:hypothetical protein